MERYKYFSKQEVRTYSPFHKNIGKMYDVINQAGKLMLPKFKKCLKLSEKDNPNDVLQLFLDNVGRVILQEFNKSK